MCNTIIISRDHRLQFERLQSSSNGVVRVGGVLGPSGNIEVISGCWRLKVALRHIIYSPQGGTASIILARALTLPLPQPSDPQPFHVPSPVWVNVLTLHLLFSSVAFNSFPAVQRLQICRAPTCMQLQSKPPPTNYCDRSQPLQLYYIRQQGSTLVSTRWRPSPIP